MFNKTTCLLFQQGDSLLEEELVYENRIEKSKEESKKIIEKAKSASEKNIIEKTKKFHQSIEIKKKELEFKINQLKENAIKDIKNISVKISIETVEYLLKNSIDKKKLENFYNTSLEQTKLHIKKTRA